MPKTDSVDDYLRAAPPAGQAAFADVRAIVRAVAPDAQERMSYGIPTFFVGGKRLVHVGLWKDHLALYPIPSGDDAFAAEIGPFVKGKGTLHFPYAGPSVTDVIARVVGGHFTRLGLDPRAVAPPTGGVAPASDPIRFNGIPEDAWAFYRELAQDNSKAWWEANKSRYAVSVREPLTHLVDLLADEFGEPSLFRPYRDVRFSKDKSPYKDHQGALVATCPGMGWYAQVSGTGLMVGGGFYAAAPDQLGRLRAAILDDARGGALQATVDRLGAAGFAVRGEQLKTRPRGVPADHPRLDLLRHTSLACFRDYGMAPWVSQAGLVDRVREDWRALRPLVEWLTTNVGAAAG